MSASTRKYLYGIAAALAALALAYGLIDGDTAVLWLGLVAALLGNGLAFFNTDGNVPGKHEKRATGDTSND